MKVLYNHESKVYLVQLDNSESVTTIHTDDIVEARRYFVEAMTKLFNDSVNEQLKYSTERGVS